MSKMYIGKKGVVPVISGGNTKWEDIGGSLVDNPELKEALDDKVTSAGQPNLVYGTDVSGQDTTYKPGNGIELKTVRIPDEYQQLEYISSTGDNIAIENEQFTSHYSVMYNSFTTMKTALETASTTVGFDVNKLRFVVYQDTHVWIVYAENDEQSEEYTRFSYDDGGSALQSNYGVTLVNYAGYSLQDGDTFTIHQLSVAGHQLIDTGIEIKNQALVASFIPEESSTSATFTIPYPSFFQDVLSNNGRQQGKNFIGARVEYSGTSTSAGQPTSIYLLADDETEWCMGTGYYGPGEALGYTTSGSTQQGDIAVFKITSPEIVDDFEITTEARIPEWYCDVEQHESSYTGSKPMLSTTLFGSQSISGAFGIGGSVSYNDGLAFLHWNVSGSSRYIPYANNGFTPITLTTNLVKVGTEETSIDSSTRKIRTANTMLLFGSQREPQYDQITYGDCSLKRFTIKKNNVVVRDYIPALRKEDNVAGMYDLVTEQFYESESGTPFVAGTPTSNDNVIGLSLDEKTALFGTNIAGELTNVKLGDGLEIVSNQIPEDYIELEYIESKGDTTINQSGATAGPVFSTGVRLNTSILGSLLIEAKYKRADAQSGYYGYLYGVHATYSTSTPGMDYFSDGASMSQSNTTSNTSPRVNSTVVASMRDTDWHTYRYHTNYGVYIDNVFRANCAMYTGGEVYSGYDFTPYFFGYNDLSSSKGVGNFKGRISYFKLYRRDDSYNFRIFRNFVPVKRKSDSKLGFYETVTGVFHENLNPAVENRLVAGPEGSAFLEVEDPTANSSLLSNVDSAPQASGNIYEKQSAISSMTKTGNYNTVIGVSAKTFTGHYNTIYGYNASSNGNAGESTLIGASTATSGRSAIVVGYSASNNADYGLSIGYRSNTSGNNSIAIGYNTKGSAQYGVALGNYSEAFGQYAVRIGGNSSNDTDYRAGQYSVVIGGNAKGNANYRDVLVGYGTQALGNDATAIGYQAKASNMGVAVGTGAYGSYAGIAIGQNITAPDYTIGIGQSWNNSMHAAETIAIGYGVRALGASRSVIIGRDAGEIASSSPISTYSVVLGYNAKLSNSNVVVIGERSSGNGAYSIAIGSQAQVINSSATTEDPCLHSIAIGAESSVDQSNAIALGYKASASGYNVAIGQNARATNNNEVAIGTWASTSGSGGIAIGESTVASNRSVSIGNGASSTDAASTAIGPNASAEGHSSIAIGNETHAVWDSSFAIGHGAEAGNGYYSLAIGNQAKAYGQYATQISEGTNNYPNTLQFRTYQLVDSDGYIPSDRLSGGAQDGYVLSYNGATGRMSWVEQSGGGGGYVLPIASASTLGGIKVGDGLQINASTGVLSVVGGTGGGDGVWGQITGNLEDQIDLKEVLDTKSEYYINMPTASAQFSGKTVQFVGTSDLMYHNGYFYNCQYSLVPSCSGYTSDDTRFGVSFDAIRFEKYCAEYMPSLVPEDEHEYVLRYDGDGWDIDSEWYIDDTAAQYAGIYVTYYGANEPEPGDEIYMTYISKNNPDAQPGYHWERIDTQPSHEIVDNCASWSTTDGLSANQGRLLQNQIDNISAIGTFLAIWDANRQGNNARYLDDGYEYTRGNYFIVGAVDTITEPTDTYTNQVHNSGSYTFKQDENRTYHHYNPSIDTTYTFTWNTAKQRWVDDFGNEFKHSYDSSGSTWSELGFLVMQGQSIYPVADLVDTDKFIVNVVFPHNYMPAGSTYDITAAGCERTLDDVQVSDMYFYDGTNWILLANHSQSIAIDSQIDSTSKNPVENRAVYSALNGKVAKSNTPNVLYGNNASRQQTTFTLGDNLSITENVLDVDLSSKQDTLVSGTNIKTINGESLLGSGNIVIQGGGSSDAMGTINIASLDGRAAGVEYPERDILQDEYKYKGSFNDICFTTNADIDYIKEHQNDLYFTFSRRSTKSKTYNVIDDHRYDTDVKVHCWRVPTRSYYNNYEWRWLSYDDILSRDNISDINYTYFYTLEDYGDDVADLVEANPYIYIAPLSNQSQDSEWKDHDIGFEYGGNWTTNFNQLELADNGKGAMTLSQMYAWVGKEGYTLNELIERVPVFDITKIANPNNEFLNKMRGRLYTNEAGEKVYCYAVQGDWYDNAGQIYAPLDNEDEVILNYVPSDKREIRAWLTTGQLESAGWTLSEVRNDLTYYRLNVSHTSANVADMISDARSAMTAEQDSAGDQDRGWGRYYFDNPICPTRFSECKFVITKVPYEKVWNEDEGGYVYPSDAYSDYMNQAYTLKEIEEDETLSELFAMQEQIMIVPNWDSYNLWMRMLGWESSVYSHRHSQDPKEADEPLTKPLYGYDEWDNWIWLTDEQTGEPLYEPYQLWAESYERHDLINALWKSGGITNHSEWQTEYGNATDFNDATGSRSGISSAPKWNCSGCHKYWMPVQFNIMTGKDLTYGMKSKSTPVSKKLTIIGNGASYIF